MRAAPLTEHRVRLEHREPLEPGNLFGHLIATGVPGVEEFDGTAYRAAVALPHGDAIIELRPPDRPGVVEAVLRLADARDFDLAVARCRFALDLDARPEVVDDALAADLDLRPLVHAVPGRRVPRTLDPDAFLIRAVLGQQVSTAAARTHAGRIAAALGRPIDDPAGGLTRVFPSGADLVEHPETLHETARLPLARRRTLAVVAEALATGAVRLEPAGDVAATRAALLALPGIGPWTVETVAMRALGDADAFPATDLGVLQAADRLGIARTSVVDRAATWSPYRAYAVQHLWATSAHAVNRIPTG